MKSKEQEIKNYIQRVHDNMQQMDFGFILNFLTKFYALKKLVLQL